MTTHEDERNLVNAIFGREYTIPNLSRRIGASIYHSVLLHPGLTDPKFIRGIEKTMGRLMSKKDMEKFRKAHAELKQHSP